MTPPGLVLALLVTLGMFTKRRGARRPAAGASPTSSLGSLDPLGALAEQARTGLGALQATPVGTTTTTTQPASSGGALSPEALAQLAALMQQRNAGAGAGASPTTSTPTTTTTTTTPARSSPTSTTSTTTRTSTTLRADNREATPSQITAGRMFAQYLASTARPDPARVREFQRQIGGVAVDGIVGPQTRERLGYLGVRGIGAAQTAAANPMQVPPALNLPGFSGEPRPTVRT